MSEQKRQVRKSMEWFVYTNRFYVITIVAVFLPILAGRPVFGSEDKLRIIVDKVVSYSTQPYMTAEQMREIVSVGFNVVSPRWGGEDVNIVLADAILAENEGISFMPFIRGSGYTTDSSRKMVWADGSVQEKLISPNDDELWNYIESLLVSYANISILHPSLIGTFIDFENYDKVGSRGQCYHLSYDMKILNDFADVCGITIPSLAPAERYPWLNNNGYHDAFAAFQINSWRQRLRSIRQQIDAINPHFLIAVYPVPGTLFITEAVFSEWATANAHLILADASTYARPHTFLKERVSLDQNKLKLQEHIAFVADYNIPYKYVGGIDPVLEMEDAEFCGKNADMLASVSDGYWVFYEGPTVGQPDHTEFFEWFRRANDSIISGRFNLQYMPRQSAEVLGPNSVARTTNWPVIIHDGLSLSMNDDMSSYSYNGGKAFEVHWMDGMTESYMSDADIILLQNSKRLTPFTPYMKYLLRSYVHRGGNIFIMHLGWAERGCTHPLHLEGRPYTIVHPQLEESLFPEVAGWAVPEDDNEGNYVLDSLLVVTNDHPITGYLTVGSNFNTASPDHMILDINQQGEQVIRDNYGNTVVVAGKYGRGKVIYSGCFYGYTSPYHGSYTPAGSERELFYSSLEWLAEPPNWIVEEKFNIDPTSSGNGWAVLQRAGNITINTVAGTCNIDSIGDGVVSPQFYLASGPNLNVNWTNVEFVQTAYQTECPDTSLASWSNGVWVQTDTWKYLVGIEVVNLGGGNYRTTVKAWNAYPQSPGLIGSYILPDTDVNEHRYNIELNNSSGELKVYVDAYEDDLPIITGTALTGYHTGRAVYFGDLVGGNGNFIPNGNATWNSLTLSTCSLLPPAEPKPEFCGDENTVYFELDVAGPNTWPDCYVDFYDFAVLTEQWMQCTDPASNNCL